MSALGTPVLINSNRAYWLSSIANDVIHSTIQTDTIDANFGNISSLFANDATVSTAKFSTFGVANLDVSGMYVSSIRGNTGFFSSLSLASDLSGGLGYVRFSVDASGIQVDGDPIRFDNLVYLTSTINIIQVSTLIDTDIFAQRGFFSSISTGNFSCGQAAINQANISSLYVSSLEAYDISGAEPSQWSLYPTLNSSIIFQPGFVLSNIGSNIYFAGQNLLADLSGANLWSIYPAQSTILANNNSMTGISTLQFQDSAKLYSQTGNNLFYNGQPIQYGANSNVSQWANYPAVNNVNMNTSSITNATLVSASNLVLTGSNVTSGNTFTNSLGVGGTSLVSLATVNSLGQAVFQDVDVGSVAIGLGDLNVYGNLALPGDNALYVQGGVTFTGNGVPVHGTTIGCGAQVGGFDTIRMDILPAGGIFQTTTLPWAATSATSASLTAGGILTLAGGSEIEANTSDFNIINTTSGNKATTLTVGNILSPSDIAATSSLTIQNIAGGGIQIQAGGQGSMTGFSTVQGSNLSSINLDVSTINGLPFESVITPSNIVCSNISTTISTNTNQLFAQNINAGLIFYSQGLAISTTIGALRVNNIQIADNLTGVTNAPNPNQSRLLNFSTVNSFNVSTTDLWVSSINGQVPGGGGGGGGNINNYSTLTASSFTVSSISLPVGNQALYLQSPIAFTSPGTIERVQLINTDQSLNLNIFANNLGIAAFNTTMQSLSTSRISTSALRVSTVQGAQGFLDVSGGINVTNDVNIPDGRAVGFGGVGYTRLERRDIATNNMLSATNFAGLSSNNMAPLGVGEIWLTGGADTYPAVRIYNDFPYTNFGIDQIDGNGVTLYEYMYGDYYNTGLNPGYVTVINGLSSFSGFRGDGAYPIVTVLDGIQTSSILVSTINGIDPVDYANTSLFSTIYTSSLFFSTATSVGSNANFNYPILLDYDQAGNINAGVAIAVRGHSFGTGNVQNQIEIGCRGNGNNYIMSVWPGQNLEDLYIDATDVTFNDGHLSTIINTDPYGLVTNAAISTPALLVSSINGLDARPAYTNTLTLSTMELYNASTTLMYWDTQTTHSNINCSGYDAVAGVNGTYKIGTSFQFISGGSPNSVEFFLLKNNNVISQSGGIQVVPNNEEIVTYVESVESLVNGDVIQVGCYTAGTGVFVSTINGSIIQSPAVILTMYKVD